MKFADIQNYSGSEADEKGARSASRTGKARGLGLPDSEADEKGARSASRMGKARFPGFLSSEADGKET